jgi:hypothetical protein
MYNLPRLYSEAMDITEEEASPITGSSSSDSKVKQINKKIPQILILDIILLILFLFRDTSYYIK